MNSRCECQAFSLRNRQSAWKASHKMKAPDRIRNSSRRSSSCEERVSTASGSDLLNVKDCNLVENRSLPLAVLTLRLLPKLFQLFQSGLVKLAVSFAQHRFDVAETPPKLSVTQFQRCFRFYI